MARIRTIKPEFWTDSKTGKLSPLATKLFLGLLNFADDYGVIRWDLEEFKVRIMPYAEGKVAELIGKPMTMEILPLGLAVWFSINGKQYLHISGFSDHQYISHPGKANLPGWKQGMTPDSYAASQHIESVDLSLTLRNAPESSGILQMIPAGREGIRKGKEWKGKEEETPCVESAKTADSPMPKKQPKPQVGTDERFKPFVEAIDTYWKFKNKIPLTWDASEGKKLNSLLAAQRNLTLEQFRDCLNHRARSDVVHSERPRVWIENVISYANGPLDRYGKPLEGNGNATNQQQQRVSPAEQRQRSIAETNRRVFESLTGSAFDGGDEEAPAVFAGGKNPVLGDVGPGVPRTIEGGSAPVVRSGEVPTDGG